MNKSIDQKKYENIILYICHKLGGSVSGKKKFYKLLYYIDFDNFEYHESMHSMTGEEYKAWKMGPVPQNFPEVIASLERAGKITHTTQNFDPNFNAVDVYTANTPADDTIFSEDEKYILDRVIEKYGRLNGKQLEILTHAEAPYIATAPNEAIAYELAFYRGTNFHDSVATS